ncbi:MAG: YfiH family protein [Methylophagaceae bacterium]|jgi:YfiH family protein
MTADSLISLDWPAPDTIKALSTTRQGGFSLPPYDSFNLGTHVGDQLKIVIKNRDYLVNVAQLPESPRWLNQIHGTRVINSNNWQLNIDADAIVSHEKNHICTIMTADCLPLLLCNKQGDTVAAIHAGWRGLAAGIIEKTLTEFRCAPQDIMAWLGPAIGPSHFEVGPDVYQTFTQHSAKAMQAFQQTDATHYLADIYVLARQRLAILGVNAVFGGDLCTATDKQRFFSYRRDDITGRMASMIWISPK